VYKSTLLISTGFMKTKRDLTGVTTVLK